MAITQHDRVRQHLFEAAAGAGNDGIAVEVNDLQLVVASDAVDHRVGGDERQRVPAAGAFDLDLVGA